MCQYTPMLNQYLSIKKDYEDCFLFFRLGDFYEMFFQDAIDASEILGITLTKKSAGKDAEGNPKKIDMCGVPFHSAENYITKLVLKGHKVAVCEQLQETADDKKIVEREVVRVVTPGTLLDTTVLDETKNNYIMCIYENISGFGLACADASTGDFLTTEFNLEELDKVIDEIAKFNPAEIICNDKILSYKQIEKIFDIKLNPFPKDFFNLDNCKETLKSHFRVKSLTCFGIEESPLCKLSSGALLSYLVSTQKTTLSHITYIRNYHQNKYMLLDISSRRNLELTETVKDKSKKGSLLWVLDKTKTPMGARLLRNWIEQPLIDPREINRRLESVEIMKENLFLREEIKDSLKTILDIERLCSKTVYFSANARDLLSLKQSFKSLPKLKESILSCETQLFKQILKKFDTLEDLYNLLENSINEDTPISLREGNLIKTGYNSEIDYLRNMKNNSAKELLNLETKEKELTGIKNLKIGYNKVFGYFIEITKSNLDLVPPYFIRKQTLANCERFITEDLKTLEDKILISETKVTELEYNLFCEIRDKIAENIRRIQETSNNIAIIDVLQSLGQVAETQKYSKPKVTSVKTGTLEITGGRHPVVEVISTETFIPNDTILDENDNLLNIITGPNMSGKSTYMRQVALITLMSQIGSFVPATSAKISIVDRIFTRVGASDDLATGQSTFMIEMNEVANIVNNATNKSLLILDEIGRGTSTYDGVSIAWAVLEHIATVIKARTLFATHYHEITTIEGRVSGVNNYCTKVQENGKDIVFLRNIIRGIAGQSYGIQVAELAGIPKSIIDRANEILTFLSALEKPTTVNFFDTDDENFYYNQKAANKTVLFIQELSRELETVDENTIDQAEAFAKLLSIKDRLANL